jgi:hypothetical protein
MGIDPVETGKLVGKREQMHERAHRNVREREGFAGQVKTHHMGLYQMDPVHHAVFHHLAATDRQHIRRDVDAVELKPAWARGINTRPVPHASSSNGEPHCCA